MFKILFRINYKNYLLHMLDYFTKEELMNFQYIVISAEIPCYDQFENIVKTNVFYPAIEDIINLASNIISIETFRRNYKEYLTRERNHLYKVILQPIVKNYHNYLIMNGETEDLYIDILTEYIYENYRMSCIDLNELFTKGYTDLLYIDRTDIHNRVVKIARSVRMEELRTLELTYPGRVELICHKMTKSEKLNKLKALGIKPKADEDINLLLLEVWADELRE